MRRKLVGVVLAAVSILSATVYAQGAGGRSVTQGLATKIIDNLYVCPEKVPNHRISAVGKITSQDGKEWTVPAETITYAFKVVDWEEDLGIGTETNFGSKTRFYQGDGGLIARFSDGTPRSPFGLIALQLPRPKRIALIDLPSFQTLTEPAHALRRAAVGE